MCYTDILYLMRGDIDEHYHSSAKYDSSRGLQQQRTPSRTNPFSQPTSSSNPSTSRPAQNFPPFSKPSSSTSSTTNPNIAPPSQSSSPPLFTNHTTTQPSTNTNDLLSQPNSTAPLSRLNGVQHFVNNTLANNTLANQTNITAYSNQLKARLDVYFSDTHGYGQPPNATQFSTEVQGAGNASCDRLAQIHRRTVTDNYAMQVLLNQPSKHIHRVREVMVSSICQMKSGTQ